MKENSSSKFLNLIIPILTALFNVFMLISPKEMIAAVREGVSLWANSVLPSLFPFIAGVNILSGLGFLSFMGAFLNPVMKPLFGVSGEGGIAFVTGFLCGYPMGAKTVGDLRMKNKISGGEAQALLSFANNCGPLFILGTAGVSLFGSKSAGYFILTIHYLAALINGVLYRAFNKTGISPCAPNRKKIKPYHAMMAHRKAEGKSIGEILTSGVKNAVETVLLIGGFLVLFCVILKILEITNFIRLCSYVCGLFGLSPKIAEAVLAGIAEMTNGAKKISETGLNKHSLIICGALISFGGLSVHAQSVSFLYKCDISILKYIRSKAMHAVITVCLGYILFAFL